MSIRLITLFALLFAAPMQAQIAGIDIDGPFVRVKRNKDGTKTVFERGNDMRTLTKKTYNAEKRVVMTTLYRLDDNGNPLKCDIFDGAGNKIYKTAFGYSKRPGVTYGKLVQELLFDVRVKRYYDLPDKSGKRKEMPVHVIQYRYSADGSPLQPFGTTLIKGKTFEEAFGIAPESQALPDLDTYEKVNPSAKPLGR